jgi:hypothetical protein
VKVVLREGQCPWKGHAMTQSLMAHLGIGQEDLIDVAYVDLLRNIRP